MLVRVEEEGGVLLLFGPRKATASGQRNKKITTPVTEGNNILFQSAFRRIPFDAAVVLTL
jgi:hypothetical protein